MKAGDMDELVNREEAGRILGRVSSMTIWRLVKAGELRPVKIGGRTLYRQSDLRALMERGSASTSARRAGPTAAVGQDKSRR
jgi:excisionase family DNA binding protein